MAEHCDVLMAVPLTETPRIQEVHLVTYHAICAALEDQLWSGRRTASARDGSADSSWPPRSRTQTVAAIITMAPTRLWRRSRWVM